MATVTLTSASCNTPQGHADTIPHSPTERVDFLVRVLNSQDVDVIALQEFGPALEPGWAKHPRWSVVTAPNNNLPWQRKAQNAIAYRNDKLRVLDVRNLAFRLPGRRIYMPAVLFEHKETKAVFVVICIHVPTRRDASELKRQAINLRLMAYALRCERKGFPVLVAGDRNDGHLPPWVTPFKRGIQHQVDWVLGSARVTFGNGRKITSVHHKVTDHPVLILVKSTLRSKDTASDELP